MPDYRFSVPSVTPGDYNITPDMFALLFSDPGKANVAVGNNYTYAGASQVAEYPTTATTNAAHLAADKTTLNTNKDEMIAANDSLRAVYDCDAGTAPTGAAIIVESEHSGIDMGGRIIDILNLNVTEV